MTIENIENINMQCMYLGYILGLAATSIVRIKNWYTYQKNHLDVIKCFCFLHTKKLTILSSNFSLINPTCFYAFRAHNESKLR